MKYFFDNPEQFLRREQAIYRLAMMDELCSKRWSWWLCACMNFSLVGLDLIPWIEFADEKPNVVKSPYTFPTEAIAKAAGTPHEIGKRLTTIAHELLRTTSDRPDLIARYWLYQFGDPAYPECPKIPENLRPLICDWDFIGQLMAHPADWAAWLLHETIYQKGGSAAAWFPTPVCLCKMMVKMVSGEPSLESRLLTVNEPCLGTGRMLLEASNYHLGLTGCDIDPAMVAWSKFQFWLYVPWIVHGNRRLIRELREYDDRSGSTPINVRDLWTYTKAS